VPEGNATTRIQLKSGGGWPYALIQFGRLNNNIIGPLNVLLLTLEVPRLTRDKHPI